NHPWITKNGEDPLRDAADNLLNASIQLSATDIDHALTRAVTSVAGAVTALRAASRLRMLARRRREEAQAADGGSTPSAQVAPDSATV
ncbi:hypothetical protein H696_06180, partial [Fonticula alba]